MLQDGCDRDVQAEREDRGQAGRLHLRHECGGSSGQDNVRAEGPAEEDLRLHACHGGRGWDNSVGRLGSQQPKRPDTVEDADDKAIPTGQQSLASKFFF